MDAATTTPAAADTRSLTIDTCRFDGAEIEDCCWEASSRVSKCSNSAFHRMGQPSWWARVDSTFLKIGHVRADQECPDIDAEQVVAAMGSKQSTRLIIGYGKAGHKDARRWSFALHATT